MSLPKDALTDAEKAKLKETFSKIDTNNDGFLGKDEIINVFAKTGRKLTSVQVQRFFEVADVDGDGKISFDNFCLGVVAIGVFIRIAMLIMLLFREMDTNQDGCVDEKELRGLFERAGCGDQITDEEIKDIIKRVDTSGDGKVSIEEFVDAIASRIETL